jgi:hypothetical protein
MSAWKLGGRLLLAASCFRCGKLLPGDNFHRHYRNSRDKAPYIDHRCSDCKWGSKAKRRVEAEL